MYTMNDICWSAWSGLCSMCNRYLGILRKVGLYKTTTYCVCRFLSSLDILPLDARSSTRFSPRLFPHLFPLLAFLLASSTRFLYSLPLLASSTRFLYSLPLLASFLRSLSVSPSHFLSLSLTFPLLTCFPIISPYFVVGVSMKESLPNPHYSNKTKNKFTRNHPIKKTINK
jgi:hypothetical protein